MKIELRKLSDDQALSRQPPPQRRRRRRRRRSIREFGFRQPIVVDEDGVIIVGHTRWKAAQKLGLDKVPVHVATDLTPEQIKAYRIADNQTRRARRVGSRPAAARAGRTARRWTSTWACSASTQDELAKLLDRRRARRADRSGRRAGAAGRGDHAAWRPVDPRRAPAAVRRLQQARGRGPAARRRRDPPGQHRPAVQREGRAAVEQRHRRRA